MKLDKRRPEGAEKARGVTDTHCPERGSKDIEWYLKSPRFRDEYRCRDCGYQGVVVVKTDTPRPD